MPPQVFAGRYELLQRLGRGAMGEVWSGVDRQTGSPVAVKIARSFTALEPELLERFEREGKLLRRMKSPFICALVDAGRDGDVPYLVLERLEGETLEELLTREGLLPMAVVGRVADEILQALVIAHAAGIVHRDLSPSNVFMHVDKATGRPRTKVLDFGVAKVDDSSAPSTAKRATVGSLPYIAPEQLGEAAKAGPRADLYAVGTIVFRALTGRMPYGDAKGTNLVVMKRETDAPSIEEVTGEKWPAPIRTFLAKTMARTPAKRYASAEIALAALRAAIQAPGPRLELPEKPPDATPTLTLGDLTGRKTR